MSGMLIILRKPFRVGDLVETGGETGVVKHITLRSTLIHSPDGLAITIPNRQVFQNKIIDYSLRAKRRVELSLGVSYAEDLDKVRRVTLDALKGMKLQRKKIEVYFTELGTSAISVKIRFWIRFGSSNAAYLQAKSEAIERVKKAYARHRITMPYDVLTLDVGPKTRTRLKSMLD